MTQFARRASLVAMSVVTAVLPSVSSSAEQPKPVIIEEGVREGVKFSVTLSEQVPPGSSVVSNIAQYGGVATAVQYYYAGISQGTIHLFRIVREVAPLRETERLPILLPLDSNGTASLLIRPQEGRTFVVRLKRSADGATLNASVVK